MSSILIKNGFLINEGKETQGDLLIVDDRIEKVGGVIDQPGSREIDAEGLIVMPGIIDDQVHFREPGLTHKATIASESRAAIAGGVTSFMEMPNTKPPALTQELLADKYEIARRTSAANYSFFMGTSNDNYDEVMRTDPSQVCGVKIFMGSSTGNLLVDDEATLRKVFADCPLLIATHCEDEATIKSNLERMLNIYGAKNLQAKHHPVIRNNAGCLASSTLAVKLAKELGTRLHVLHISTDEEIALFKNELPLTEKKITAEVCVHHLYFDADDYETLGNRIKCNPAIKAPENKVALFQAMLDDRLDIIATDHAPHTWDEKMHPYVDAPSGLPLVQHSLNIMLHFYHQKAITLPKMVEKMCHSPAICFRLKGRGFLREGYFADVILVDPNSEWILDRNSILYKCGWSPLEGSKLKGSVQQVILNGQQVYSKGSFFKTDGIGMRLEFDR
jgi:dihydroorotase